MEKILSQDEIDQLFRAAQGGAPKTRPAVERPVKECDFRQAGQLSKDQVRQVTLLHETFPPNLGSSLGAYLRVGIQATLVAVEQISYSEFLTRLPEQTYVATIALLPAEEWAAVQLEMQLLLPMIDLLLGGSGQATTEPRDLTEIEEQILESVVALICREIQATWRAILPLDFTMGTRQKQAQILTLMMPGERALYLSFELQLNEIRGLLNLVFPAAISNALLRKLALQGTVQRRPSAADYSGRLRDRLLDCEFTSELQLTNLPIRIGDIVDLRPGAVLPLRHALHDSMSFAVNGRPVFRGVPVSCGPLRGALLQEKVETQDVHRGERR
jgi:flagellar motor switch protein FliM